MAQTRLQIGDATYTWSWLQQHPDAYETLLASFRDRGGRTLYCLCRPSGVPMYVGKRNRHYIARTPNTAPDHDADCAFYRAPAAMSGRGCYNAQAIQERDDGITAIRLDTPLTRRRPAPDPDALGDPAAAAGRPGVRRGGLTLLGLLHYLWEEAGFHRWTPNMDEPRRPAGKRSWWVIRQHLLNAAASVRLQRRALGDLLYIPQPFRQDARTQINRDRAAFFRTFRPRPGHPPPRMLAVGELRDIAEDEYAPYLRLTQDSTRFYIAGERLRALQRRFGRELAGLGEEGLRVLIIASVDFDARDDGAIVPHLVDAGAMRTTLPYIPVDSRLEAQVADQLRQAGRRYEKPLRYDATEPTFPDFLLWDTDPRPYRMEVYGMTGNPAYDERKREKRAWYRQNGIPVWEWEPGAGGDDSIPPFPTAHR